MANTGGYNNYNLGLRYSKQALTNQINALENACKAPDTVPSLASLATKLRLSSMITEALKTLPAKEIKVLENKKILVESIFSIDDEEY